MSKRSPISKLTHLKLGQNSSSENLMEDSIEKMNPSSDLETKLPEAEMNAENAILAPEEPTKKMEEWAFPSQSSETMSKKMATEITQTPALNNKINLPKFLEQNKILQSVTNSVDGEIKMLPFSGNDNPNSFSSIFSRDHDEITGIRRVFRKSFVFLTLHLFFFLVLTWCGLTLLTLNPIISLFCFVSFVAITNLFYIIVADRSYVSISLLSSAIGLLLIYSFLGQAFNPVSLVGVGIITLLSYISYTEIEKIQLGSRLFTISNIVGSATRILIGVGILILSVSIFNQMISEGSTKYISRTIFSNNTVVSKFIVGEESPVSLNRIVMSGASFYSTLETNTVPATFKDFLATNYKRGEDVVSKSQEPEIIITCENEKGSGKCGNAVADVRNTRLESYRSESYNNLPYTLDTVLTKENFREISKQYYLNIISEFDKGSSIIIPRVYLLPGIFAALLYIVLSLFSPLLAILIQGLTWLGWQIMKFTGFAKIEVETVESEVVSI